MGDTPVVGARFMTNKGDLLVRSARWRCSTLAICKGYKLKLVGGLNNVPRLHQPTLPALRTYYRYA